MYNLKSCSNINLQYSLLIVSRRYICSVVYLMISVGFISNIDIYNYLCVRVYVCPFRNRIYMYTCLRQLEKQGSMI